ncbi:DUF4298 domain-containing protein [Neisseria sp. CCUG12390]|uniref:DUF4298 domain-containing protein n=1 Tax=Neisseria sp. CCUG12390 TaxID=3392035 RepID=UPI003A0FF1C1
MQPDMQPTIDRIQSLYREWLDLQAKLESAQKDWQRSRDIMQELSTFYFDGEYQNFYARIENGEHVNLRTDGEYSVMSEDALWNAFHDQSALAWERLRTSVAVLDPEQN